MATIRSREISTCLFLQAKSQLKAIYKDNTDTIIGNMDSQLLYDKREVPYEQFIEMVYSIMEDTKKPENKRMTEEEINKKVSEFSRGLTLWGSNRVVKKWIKYRKNAAQNPDKENLFLLEQILYEMRKDVGLRRKMKKGVMLSFFINDIENALKK